MMIIIFQIDSLQMQAQTKQWASPRQMLPIISLVPQDWMWYKYMTRQHKKYLHAADCNQVNEKSCWDNETKKNMKTKTQSKAQHEVKPESWSRVESKKLAMGTRRFWKSFPGINHEHESICFCTSSSSVRFLFCFASTELLRSIMIPLGCNLEFSYCSASQALRS